MNETIKRIQAQLRDVKLSPPLPESRVVAFEVENSIRLPQDYREFLLSVGEHGEGSPTYGLLPLGHTDGVHVPDYLRDGYGDRLKRDFPLTRAWMWEDEDDDASDTLPDKVRSTEQGCLVLGDDGCAMYWVLIISGSCRGEIWQRTGEGMGPCWPRLKFGEWYLKWLMGDTDWWPETEPIDGPREGFPPASPRGK